MFDADFGDIYAGAIPGKLGNSQEDKIFLQKAEECITFQNSHYVLPLPFRDPAIMLQNNRQYVLKRMQYQKIKLSENGRYYDDYVTAMDNLVPENGRACYLPQHGIYHPTKPNKFRLASGKIMWPS